MTVTDSIKQTLAYFSLFDHALTTPELHRLLIQPREGTTVEKVHDTLRQGIEGITQTHGAWHLATKGGVNRLDRTSLFETKMKRARKAVRLLRHIPFLRAVFVCNQLQNTAKDSSDVDVVIICRHGMLWFVRFWAILLMAATRQRIQGGTSKDKICLSFYLSDTHLDLHTITTDHTDIYLAYWVTQLLPVYDPHGVLPQLLRANQWVYDLLPHAMNPIVLAPYWRVSLPVMPLAVIGEWTMTHLRLLWFNTICAAVLRWRIDQKNIAHKYGVIMNEHMLKFHEEDRRTQFFTTWQQTYAAME